MNYHYASMELGYITKCHNFGKNKSMLFLLTLLVVSSSASYNTSKISSDLHSQAGLTTEDNNFETAQGEEFDDGNVTRVYISDTSVNSYINETNLNSTELPILSSSLETENISSWEWSNVTKNKTTDEEVFEILSSDSIFNAGVIAGIVALLLIIVIVLVVTGYLTYRHFSWNRPQTLTDKFSNDESTAYIDDTAFRENSEEMYSLDNDSFLNSLEAMTIQNYWTDHVKHTKL